MLDDAVLIYKEFDFTGLIRAGVHSLQRHGHIVVCSNSRCYEGGYDLQPEIKKMMSRKSKRKAIFLQCDGSETNGPRSEDACTGSIEGTLVLKTKKL